MHKIITLTLVFISWSAMGQLIYPTSQAAANPFLHPKDIMANREIVLIYDSSNDVNYSTNQKFYDVNTLNPLDINTTIALNTNMPVYPGLQSFGNRHIGQATGDFNNDNRDEYVVATEGASQTIVLRTYGAQAIAGNLTVVPQASGTALGPLNNSSSPGQSRAVGWMKLSCGDFNGDGDDEIALLYRDNSTSLLTIKLLDVVGNSIVEIASVADEAYAVSGSGSSAFESFDLQAADLDFDGTFEVVLAAAQANNNTLQPYIKVYDVVDAGGFLTFAPRSKAFVATSQSISSKMSISLAMGDFNNDLIFEIALTYGFMIPNNSGNNPDTFIRMFRVGDNSATPLPENDWLESIELMPAVFSTTKSVDNFSNLDMDAGDMNGDGRDDLVLATGTDIQAFFVDTNWNFLSQNGIGTFTNATDTDYDQFMTVADMNNDGRAEIVNIRNWIFEGSNFTQRFSIVVHRWDTPTNQFVQLATNSNQMEVPYYTGGDQRQFILGVGDFDGDEISFGDYNYYVISEVQEPILILNAPPTHQDNIGPNDWVDVNGQFVDANAIECGPSQAFYNTEQQTNMAITATYSSDWSVGVEVGAELDLVVASINTSINTVYGQSATNSTEESETFVVSNSYTSCFDDGIYAAVLNYEVFEYPIYAGDTLVTYLISVHPTAPQFEWVQSRSSEANGYLPSHEPGNLLSYRKKPPVESNLGGNARFAYQSYNVPQGNQESWTISTQTTTQTTAETTNTVDIETSASASAFGLTLGVSGTYNQTNISTRSMGVSSSTTIGVAVSGTTPNSQLYDANAVLFWGPGGALTLDYEVDLTGNFYVQNYNQPDPALNMPWRLDQQRGLTVEDPTELFQCRSISLSKRNPAPGDTVVVSVRLYNYSLVNVVDPVSIEFYMGNPLWGGVQQSDINGQTEFTYTGGIPAQEYRTFSITWIAPLDNQLVGRLYASIDADTEIHEENNIGYLPLGINYLNQTEVSVSELGGNKVQGFLCYPNPAKERCNLMMHVAKGEHFLLEVIDLQGRTVKAYPSSYLEGFQERSIDVSDLSKGVYILKLYNENTMATTRMIVE